MFKRTLIAIAAVSMLAAPMAQAQAQSRHDNNRPTAQQSQSRDHGAQRHRAQRPVAARAKFRSGQRYGNWKRHQSVRDFRRHGLRAPGRGQNWIRVDNQYLLISAATGLILGLAAAR